MQVHRSAEDLPLFKNAIITIGTFDGVHAGHRTIINAICNKARETGGESVIITFHPHPRKIVNPDEPLHLINSLEEKIALLSETGIDHLVIIPFTPSFAALTAEEYISEFLVRNFQPSVIVIGYDHHFGKGRRGNFRLLAEHAPQFGYTLVEIPQHVLNEISVSSTKIRKALVDGAVETANALLGYSFFFEGLVIEGDKLGRKLGYPTANLQLTDPDKIRLGHGVYAVYASVAGKTFKGMMSIGNRPTLDQSDERIEVNIFDFAEEIYGQTIKVTVKAYLRAQEKYESLEQLMDQMAADKTDSLRIL